MLSYSALKIRVKRKNQFGPDIAGSSGTGFFWLHDDAVFLITAWHVVTGWDPVREKSLSPKTAFHPTHLEIPILVKPEEAFEKPIAARKRIELPLYDLGQQPRWFEHPDWGKQVDAVAVYVTKIDDQLISRPINAIEGLTDFEPYVGDDVFVLGYPRGFDGGHELAIWKRGSIASQPNVDLEKLPKILVDTATREGMSGAPVIARRRGLIIPRGVQGTPGQFTWLELIGQADTFLGVYSGRIGDDELGVQLGIVWKARVLEEIIVGQRIGQSPY